MSGKKSLTSIPVSAKKNSAHSDEIDDLKKKYEYYLCEETIRQYQSSAKAGNSEDQYKLGEAYYKIVMLELQKLNGEFVYGTGYSYDQFTDKGKDALKKGMEWLLLAAGQGHNRAIELSSSLKISETYSDSEEDDSEVEGETKADEDEKAAPASTQSQPILASMFSMFSKFSIFSKAGNFGPAPAPTSALATATAPIPAEGPKAGEREMKKDEDRTCALM